MNEEEEEANDRLAETMIDEALASYAGQVSPEILQEIRDYLGDWLCTHPEGRQLLRQARPDPVVEKSGALGATEEDATDASRTGSGDR